MEQKSPEAADAFIRHVRKHQRTVFALAYGILRKTRDGEDIARREMFREALRRLTAPPLDGTPTPALAEVIPDRESETETRDE